MKYIIAIAYLLLSFNMNALELDSVRRKEIVREGQKEFCQLLEYNSHCTSPDQMKFTVVIDGNEPTYSRVIENRVDTTGIQILSATCYDSLNAVLSRVYRDYLIEMYMIVIKTFDIAVTTPLTQPIVINNLFNNPLYDEQTNLAQLSTDRIPAQRRHPPLDQPKKTILDADHLGAAEVHQRLGDRPDHRIEAGAVAAPCQHTDTHGTSLTIPFVDHLRRIRRCTSTSSASAARSWAASPRWLAKRGIASPAAMPMFIRR